MPLQIKFKIRTSTDCKSFIFNDLTGAYSISNTGGYGSPNPAVNTITTATLKVTNPTGTVYNLNLLTNSSAMPNANISLDWKIDNTSIGLTATSIITDGLWAFEYALKFPEQAIIIINSAKLFTCQSDCCIAELLANAKLEEDCDCNDSNLKKYTKAKANLDALKAAAKCGNTQNFNTIKKIIDKICKNKDCQSCE